MDKQYLNASMILERAKEEVEYIFNRVENKIFEDKKAIRNY